MPRTMTLADLARELEVNPSSIWKAVRRLGLNVRIRTVIGSVKAARLTPEQADMIRADILGRRSRKAASA